MPDNINDPDHSELPIEEEVHLGSGFKLPPLPADIGGGPVPHPGHARAAGPMSARTTDLEGIVGPGATNEELVDAINQLGIERIIPWEVCQLPSKGFYYQWPTETLEVRAMGIAAEKILATQRLAQSGQSLDYLFRECVRYPTPDFDPMDLLVGDRVFLLYYIRGITHGNMYEFAITCPNPTCGRTSTHTYDLNELASTIKNVDPSLGEEPFKVRLPYLSRCLNQEMWVGVRFLRGRDTNNMIALRRTKKRAFATTAVRAGGRRNPRVHTSEEPTIDDTLTENLQLVIQSVQGVTNRSKIMEFVSTLHATDNAAIREWLRENSPGIETTVTLNCPECGQEFSVELPITESFFRPTQDDGDG